MRSYLSISLISSSLPIAEKGLIINNIVLTHKLKRRVI